MKTSSINQLLAFSISTGLLASTIAYSETLASTVRSDYSSSVPTALHGKQTDLPSHLKPTEPLATDPIEDDDTTDKELDSTQSPPTPLFKPNAATPAQLNTQPQIPVTAYRPAISLTPKPSSQDASIDKAPSHATTAFPTLADRPPEVTVPNAVTTPSGSNGNNSILKTTTTSPSTNKPSDPPKLTIVPIEPVVKPKTSLNPPNCPPGWQKEICIYANLIRFIDSRYANTIDIGAFIKEATKRAIGTLDRHTQYLDTEAFKELLDTRHGDFAGVGITVGSENGVLRIFEVIEDGPSDKAGLRVNDLITEIDGKPLSPLTFKEAIKLLRGTPKTIVNTTIVRPPQNKVLRLSITRDIIVTAKIKSKVFKDHYGWIRIPAFTDRTLTQLVEALEKIHTDASKKHDLKGIILDLRNNGGGSLQAAVGVAATFLQPDLPITHIVSREENRQEKNTVLTANWVHYRQTPYEANPLANLPTWVKSIPLVVLVNESSASASELVSAALQDHGRAIIMGKNTFGKGSVQSIVGLPEAEGGGAIKLTTAHYFSPKRRAINGWGVVPDIEIDHYASGDPNEAAVYREIDFAPGEFILNQDQGLKIIRERREKVRATYLQELANRKKKGLPDIPEPKPVKPGEDNDYMLSQALLQLQGKPTKQNNNASPSFFSLRRKEQSDQIQ